MEVDAPELLDTSTIEKKEDARRKKVKWKTKFDISTMVKDLVEARSVVRKLMEEVVARSEGEKG